jgi:hypothetical protein
MFGLLPSFFSIHKNYVMALSLCLAINCFATTAVVVVAPSRIVVGIDRLASSHNTAGVISSGDRTVKASLLKGRIAVACVGLQEYWDAPSPTKASTMVYDFKKWATHLETKVTSDSSIYQLVAFMEDESSRTFNKTIDVGALMKNGTMKQSESLNRFLVQYIVAGFENNTPLVIQIYYEFDWQHNRLLGPFRQVDFPISSTQGGVVEEAIKCYGYCDTITQVFSLNSYAHQRISAIMPNALKDYAAEKDTPAESIQFARVLIAIEAEVEPTIVGKGSTIISIPAAGKGGVFLKYDSPPSLPKAGTSQQQKQKASH